eukprot:scaffold51103_cov62-Phaeocystis_antarctica.AAC.2
MCCNVGGYGALSVWTFVWAVLMTVLNAMNGLMPCTQAMEAWGFHQECTAMEADFLVQQSVLWVCIFLNRSTYFSIPRTDDDGQGSRAISCV